MTNTNAVWECCICYKKAQPSARHEMFISRCGHEICLDCHNIYKNQPNRNKCPICSQNAFLSPAPADAFPVPRDFNQFFCQNCVKQCSPAERAKHSCQSMCVCGEIITSRANIMEHFKKCRISNFRALFNMVDHFLASPPPRSTLKIPAPPPMHPGPLHPFRSVRVFLKTRKSILFFVFQ